MHPLNISKIGFGCDTVDVLTERLAARAEHGTVTVRTRYRPTRHAELIGGSLYWIVKHRIVIRQTILAFEEEEGSRHCLIRLAMPPVPVRALPKRAHQGWRYLADTAAPEDLSDADADVASLPPALAHELAALLLI